MFLLPISRLAARAIKRGLPEQEAIKRARETHQYSTRIYLSHEQHSRNAVAEATQGQALIRDIALGMRWLNTFIKQIYECGPFDEAVVFDVEGEEANKAFQFL